VSNLDKEYLIHTQDLAGYFMADGEAKCAEDKRIGIERRSETDTRSEVEKRLAGELRGGPTE